jgi:hypothetical protein
MSSQNFRIGRTVVHGDFKQIKHYQKATQKSLDGSKASTQPSNSRYLSVAELRSSKGAGKPYY